MVLRMEKKISEQNKSLSLWMLIFWRETGREIDI